METKNVARLLVLIQGLKLLINLEKKKRKRIDVNICKKILFLNLGNCM
jgi:hypothetical protein